MKNSNKYLHKSPIKFKDEALLVGNVGDNYCDAKDKDNGQISLKSVQDRCWWRILAWRCSVTFPVGNFPPDNQQSVFGVTMQFVWSAKICASICFKSDFRLSHFCVDHFRTEITLLHSIENYFWNVSCTKTQFSILFSFTPSDTSKVESVIDKRKKETFEFFVILV